MEDGKMESCDRPVGAHFINICEYKKQRFLWTFEKFLQVNISFVISVYPSVHKDQLSFQRTDFNDFYNAAFFVNLWRKLKFH